MRTLVALLLCTMLVAPVAAEELKISGTDTIQTLLAAHKGKRVTLRVRGQELTGTVRDATARLVVLGALSGKEFFDAAIPIEAVDAVIVRNK